MTQETRSKLMKPDALRSEVAEKLANSLLQSCPLRKAGGGCIQSLSSLESMQRQWQLTHTIQPSFADDRMLGTRLWLT